MNINFKLLISVTITLFLICVINNPVMAVDENGGIGLKTAQLFNQVSEIDDKRGSLVVLDVFENSPAQRCGIQIGDLILKINAQITKEQSFYDLMHNHLRGSSGTEVTLKIWRPCTNEIFEFIINREPMVY